MTDYWSNRVTHVPKLPLTAVSGAPFAPIGDLQPDTLQFPLLFKRSPIFLFDFMLLLPPLTMRKLCKSLLSGPESSIPNDLGLAKRRKVN